MGLFNFLGSLLGLSGTPSSRIEVQKSPAASGLNIVYGRRRVEPVTVFKVASNKDMDITNTGNYHHYVSAYNTSREGNKDENTWLHRVDVWGQGEIEEIIRFWIDGDPSTATRFHKRPYFRAASKYGTENQTAASELASGDGEWATTHNGYGVAYTWARFFNSTKYPEFTSEPQLSALVKGVKVYDPRKAEHDFDDPSTWEYSNNRALVILNYLMAEHGFHASEDEIDLESFKLAANVCAQQVDIPPVPTNQTGTTVQDFYDQTRGEWLEILPGAVFRGQQEEQEGTTRRKYTANAVLDPKEGVIPNLRHLMEGMGWALPWSNGKIKLVIESEGKTPVLSFDEDSIIAGGMIERSMRADRWNRVTVEFPNSNKAFEQDTVSWPPLDSTEYTDYLAEDAGKAMHKIKPVRTITNYYVAQTYAEYLVRKSRVSPRITGLKLSAKALLLEPGDIISLTHADKGFNGDDFIVEKVSIGVDLSVSVDLLAYVQSVYDPSLVDEEPLNVLPYGPDIWQDPTAITDLQLTETHETNADGSMINGLAVNWTAPTANMGIIYYELFWKKKDGNYTEFPNNKLLTAVTTEAEIDGLLDDTDYTVGIRYTTSNGKTSDLVWLDILLASVDSKLAGIDDGANRTFPRGGYDDTATYIIGDVVQWNGSSYIYIAETAAVGVDPVNTSHWDLFAVGAPYKDVIFVRQETQPATPTGSDPSGWSDAPPAEDGTPVWMSIGDKDANGDLIGAWSTPQQLGGPAQEIQFSDDGADWHSPPALASDYYLRQRFAGGAWSEIIRFVGEDGSSGGYKDFVYKRSSSQPSKPSGSGASGWSDGIPAENGNPVWESWAWKNGDGSLNGNWSTPQNVASAVFERQYSVNGSGSWHTEPTEDDRYFRERLAGTDDWSDAVPMKGEGALSDLDTVDTGQIDSGAVTDSDSTNSTSSALYLPLDTAKERGSVSISTYSTSTDRVTVIANFRVKISGGKANFQPYFTYGNNTRNAKFFTAQSHHGLSTADRWLVVTAMTHFTGASIQPPFGFGISCTYYSSGCAAYLLDVQMLAINGKR